MKYLGALIAVSDIGNSRRFYCDVLGLKVVEDFGANVTLEGGIFLQTLDTWKTFIHTDQILLPNHAGELYFEEEDIEGFCDRLASLDVRYVHPLFEHRWGQRVVRFYDPDGHVIEVGERIDVVVRRFFEGSLSAAETAARMDVPIGMVLSYLGDGALRLVKANRGDFIGVRDAYLEIIDHSPNLKQYARWEYGKHPTDEGLMKFIDDGNLFLLTDGAGIAGVAAITPGQGEDYRQVQWRVDAKDHEVMTLHLFGILPRYQGAGVGRTMMRRALDMAAEGGMKAFRLDTLASNVPAQRFYESLGFVFCGRQHWYAENTGWIDFYLFEQAIRGGKTE
jgi:ribosomal protein S18 acetylase RimI-like enzyme/catechol 2,3-dioxygenase-like lactoylglutathione lyase family enzyme